MNKPTTSAWLSQLNDPHQWQSWFKAVPGAPPSPVAAALQDASVTVPPALLEQLKADYMAQVSALWQEFLAGKTPMLADRRFAAAPWQNNILSAYSAASYLLNAKFLTAMAEGVEAPARQKQKIRFNVAQIINAMSPANFLATNPEAQQKIIESKGESLTKGLSNMLADMKKGRITISDEAAFEVGRNVATTAGTVVFENELLQLIQYTPSTPTVHQRPLLMVPPCINKYYILDLQPENSLVRYAIEQGNTVFLISWRNPDASLAHVSWDDYIETGVIKAIEVTQAISGQPTLNILGFCVGGTILSTALAVLKARGENPAASLTLLTTLLDFSDNGVLDVFIDEEQVTKREKELAGGGLMPGRDLESTFSSLRPNDLIWNYVQSNYLQGKEPPAFDLLYWNADSTSLPGPMFCWYLRNTYLENSLKTPNKLTVAGASVDLSSIDAPTFIYASREDHIVPWPSAYASMGLLNPGQPSKNRFVLGASGHIAGVINPASKNKRSYWSQPSAPKSKSRAKAALPDADAWLAGATESAGSWWPEWSGFLAQHGGPEVNAPAIPGNRKYKAIEAAPGRYVKVRAA